jgi:hypothetical protein
MSKISLYPNSITTLIDTDLFDVSKDLGGSFRSDKMTWATLKANLPTGNGIFDAGNDGGTVPTGFDVVLTDTLNFDADTFVIDGTNDRIGIGIAAPIAKLHMAESVGLGAIIQASSGNPIGAAIFNLYRTRGSVGSEDFAFLNDTLGLFNVLSWNGTLAAGTASIQINATENHTAAALGTSMSFNVITNGNITKSNAIFIDNSTDVGIGTTSPTSKLHVVGSTILNGASTSIGNVTATNGFTVPIRTGASNGLVIGNSGDFTVGADRRIYLANQGVNGSQVILYNGAGGQDINLTTIPSGIVVFNETSRADLDFRIKGGTDTNLFWVDASADAIGIGTALPSAKLHVNGLGTGLGVNLKTTGDVMIGDGDTTGAALFFGNQYSFSGGTFIRQTAADILELSNANHTHIEMDGTYLGGAIYLHKDGGATATAGVVSVGHSGTDARLSIKVNDLNNLTVLKVVQNEITNNNIAAQITNTGTGKSLEINTTDFVVEGGGSVGIGIALPTEKLHVIGKQQWDLATENARIDDAGSTGATEQDWIEVTVGGVTGYIRVHATK